MTLDLQRLQGSGGPCVCRKPLILPKGEWKSEARLCSCRNFVSANAHELAQTESLPALSYAICSHGSSRGVTAG
ncbi:hypothetical protein WJX74_002686 [Apatococcus lobatus]|uniref:Uncharacterized protein n=1 Tax=Apatococcus lobatus TaxID=904363 RepID=A0AAW1R1B1_9CHLO